MGDQIHRVRLNSGSLKGLLGLGEFRDGVCHEVILDNGYTLTVRGERPPGGWLTWKSSVLSSHVEVVEDTFELSRKAPRLEDLDENGKVRR